MIEFFQIYRTPNMPKTLSSSKVSYKTRLSKSLIPVFNKSTGTPLYRYDVGYGSGFYGSPAFDSDQQNLYILSNSGNLYAFKLRQPPRKLRPHGKTDPYGF